ncbi:MAG: hypothetical protein Q9M40_05440 [Sulfurimonas sp.]|nr:hypothetical protein [Sulfurimonas sp.]
MKLEQLWVLVARLDIIVSLMTKQIDAAISDLTSNIIENMLDKPWKGYILWL